MRISDHIQCSTKSVQPFRSSNSRRLNLRIKHSSKCENVAKSQDSQVTKLRTNDHIYHRKFSGSVKVWPTVPGGLLKTVANFTGFTACQTNGHEQPTRGDLTG